MYSAELSLIETSIRSGNHLEASRRLLREVKNQPRREALSVLAGFARRLGLPSMGLKLLSPYVRPSARKRVDSTPQERTEYAGCLIRLGILGEAKDLLSTVSPESNPTSLLLKAFISIAQWNYVESNLYLANFEKFERVSDYEHLISKVNRAVGLVFLEEWKGAISLIQGLKPILEKEKNYLLLANTLHLEAKVHDGNGEQKEAIVLLSQAAQLLGTSTGFDAFLIRKDRELIIMKRARKPGPHRDGFEKLFNEANQRQYYESARDAYFQYSILSNRLDMIHKVYFGTPFEHYRNKILRKAGITETDLPSIYKWKIGRSTKTKTLDLGMENSLRVPGRLLRMLTKDFFVRPKVHDLFDSVFPNEYFLQGSADRIHQALRHLRSQFVEKRIPLSIVEKQGHYFLASKGTSGISIVLRNQNQLDAFPLLRNFHLTCTHASFTISDLVNTMKSSRRTSIREVNKALRIGLVTRHGAGPSTNYVFSIKSK